LVENGETVDNTGAVVAFPFETTCMKALLLGITLFLMDQRPGWLYNFDQAKQESVKSGKYVLINFSGSDWCIPCIKMEKQLFETDTFSHYASNHLLLVKADFPRLKKNKLSREQTELNEQLASVYNPTGKFPLTVLLDQNGKVVKEWDGLPSGDAEHFVGEINTVLHAGN
jgi:thioredoxin-related protein